MKYGIVVIAYNRARSLNRLLERLTNCFYGAERITLIISLDFSSNKEVKNLAETYNWNYGEKIVKIYKTRIGLRKHVLNCGNYMNDYELDVIAVFEDDIYPSCNFFFFMKKAADFYKNNDRIAGISLYSHQWNVNAQCMFEPYRTEYDVFFIQYAQSWGQIWTRKQWNEFYEWYLENESFESDPSLPEFVNSWPESSWLKYHIKYCVKKNKFFVYPYVSYTTCFSDIGEHTVKESTLQQVVLQEGKKEDYIFPAFNENAVKYDAFFERIFSDNIAGIKPENICVDLYQTKKTKKTRYILTTQILNYEIVASFGLRMRPQEANIINKIQGKDIFLYDTKRQKKNIRSRYDQFWCIKKYRNKFVLSKRALFEMMGSLFFIGKR